MENGNGLVIKRRDSGNTTWVEAYTGSDPKTFRIPTNLTSLSGPVLVAVLGLGLLLDLQMVLRRQKQ